MNNQTNEVSESYHDDENDSPYCDCGAISSDDEYSVNQCSCCGKILEIPLEIANTITITESEYAKLKATIDDQKALIEKMREALRFYANQSNWDVDHDTSSDVSRRVIMYKDQYEQNEWTIYAGKRAREALAACEAKPINESVK